jgi:DNA-3-methyladenine glycosylase II
VYVRRSHPLAGKEKEQLEAERADRRRRRRGAALERHGGTVAERVLAGNASSVTTVDEERAFHATVDALGADDPALAAIVERFGRPRLWRRDPGFATLVLLILEQQVSLASAKAAYDRLATEVGVVAPAPVLALDDETLRRVGFSRQKTRYVRALATAIVDGHLDLDALPMLPDAEVRRDLVALPGIGPWTADVYMLACLARPDLWPVGDVALQTAAQRALGLERRPSATELEQIGDRWRPHRSVAAQLLWHLYLGERRRL